MAEGTITVVGLSDERVDALTPEARAALGAASVVVGGRRHLTAWHAWVAAGAFSGDGEAGVGSGGRVEPEVVEVTGDIAEVAQLVRRRAVEQGMAVCVLASGDPGFFGIVRALLRQVDRRSISVLPAPSSVAVAFARLGLPWDDAAVVSAHGRPLADAVGAVRTSAKAAVFTSPETPPEALGRALLEAGVAFDLVAVCSQLGTNTEQVTELDLQQLAEGRFDPLSVVVLVGPGGLPLLGWGPGRSAGYSPQGGGAPLAWGLPDTAFEHRAGMITKAEVRAVVLSKLTLPRTGVVWDVGAGSGAVAVECALVRPGLTVLAVESSADDAARASANAAGTGAGVHVVAGRAPEVLDGLPDPDRAFVGGGGIAVLQAVLARLRPGGRVVATFAALQRAAEAAELLGNVTQISVSRGRRLPDGGWRLEAANPVFVAWGPGVEPGNPEGGGDEDDGDREGDRYGRGDTTGADVTAGGAGLSPPPGPAR